MRVLITGGAGYIGSELTSRLAKTAGVGEIVVYDNLSRGNFNLFFGDDKLGGGVRLLRADLLDSRQTGPKAGPSAAERPLFPAGAPERLQFSDVFPP
ncbi:MAG: NAD-dependent epimerase/dehydratase family protein [Gemmatimonadales bacterium]